MARQTCWPAPCLQVTGLFYPLIPHFPHLFHNKSCVIPKCSCLHPVMCPIPLRLWGAPDNLSHWPVVLGFPAGPLGLMAVLGQPWGCLGTGSFLCLSCWGFPTCQCASWYGLMLSCDGSAWWRGRVVFGFPTSYCASSPLHICRWPIYHTAWHKGAHILEI